ncbi:MAG: GAF domain-containing protein [Cyanobacteria bacterium P01_G01_bin.54]
MPLPNTGSILASLTQLTQFNRNSVLTERVKDLSINEFVCLLDFITAEFQQFLRALDMINNEALETMLEQVMDAFTLKIGQILQAEKTLIFLVDSETNQLWAKLSESSHANSRHLRVPFNVGIPGYVATHEELLNIADAPADERFNGAVDTLPGCTIQSVLCVPIHNEQDRLIAVVEMINKADGQTFSAEDETRFQEFAASIAIILDTCQSFYLAARNQRGAAALLKATSSLGQSLDLDATLRAVMEQARRLMKADRSTLFMLSRETHELWSKIATTDDAQPLEIRIPANQGIAGYVASTSQIVNIPDAYQDDRFDPSTDQRTGYRTRSILCMPVYGSGGELIGVTQLINKENEGSFSSSDEEFMQAFNTQAGIALENAKLFDAVLTEKQYQKNVLQSLSDGVVSTDLEGRIVTLNDAVLQLLGFPAAQLKDETARQLWECQLLGRLVWEIFPIDTLKFRLDDSFAYGAEHFVPEQSLVLGLATCANLGGLQQVLALPDPDDGDRYIPWNDPACPDHHTFHIERHEIQRLERSINLKVNPLTNAEGEVRGGLVILEDISNEKRMKSTLYRYMTPAVAEQVMATKDDKLMGGDRKEVSILFSDIRGYTTLTEKMAPNEVVLLLNKYFETMVESVFEHQGTLDKFMGDALMAVFGAPLSLKEPHAWLAVRSALDMRQRLVAYNQQSYCTHQPQIRIGIGISTGEVVAGNIGSPRRMDYTMIGDQVNLSARLESLTKEYGCDIIISESTYQACGGGDRLQVRELDQVRVKGKSQAVTVYELIDYQGVKLSATTMQFLDIYQEARRHYLEQQFQRAQNLFDKAHQLRPDDRTVNLYRQRCAQYLERPPAEWDGIYVMTTK